MNMAYKQEKLFYIQANTKSINQILSRIKAITDTLESLRNQGLISEEACDDIYREKVIPALNGISENQKTMTQACLKIAALSTNKSLQ